MMFKTATPYIASYVILRRGKQVAFVLRSHTGWMDGYYGLTAGKVEKDETFKQAAVREAQEEAGITVAETDLKHVMTMHRYEPDGISWVDVFFEAYMWRGEVHNAEPAVHGSVDWYDASKPPDNLVPSIKFALEQISEGKIYCEYGWDN